MDISKIKSSGDSKTFITENIELAAYLIAIKGYKLKGLQKSNRSKRHAFVFDENEISNDAVLDFFNSEFRKYSISIQDLREMLRNIQEN
jgi:hypothetical protein